MGGCIDFMKMVLIFLLGYKENEITLEKEESI